VLAHSSYTQYVTCVCCWRSATAAAWPLPTTPSAACAVTPVSNVNGLVPFPHHPTHSTLPLAFPLAALVLRLRYRDTNCYDNRYEFLATI